MHQVRIEVGKDALPQGVEPAALSERVAMLAEHWAEGCISERHAEI